MQNWKTESWSFSRFHHLLSWLLAVVAAEEYLQHRKCYVLFLIFTKDFLWFVQLFLFQSFLVKIWKIYFAQLEQTCNKLAAVLLLHLPRQGKFDMNMIAWQRMDSECSVLIFHKDNEKRKLDNFRGKQLEGLDEYFGPSNIHNTLTQSTRTLIKEHTWMSGLAASYYVDTIIRMGFNASNWNYEWPQVKRCGVGIKLPWNTNNFKAIEYRTFAYNRIGIFPWCKCEDLYSFKEAHVVPPSSWRAVPFRPQSNYKRKYATDGKT